MKGRLVENHWSGWVVLVRNGRGEWFPAFGWGPPLFAPRAKYRRPIHRAFFSTRREARDYRRVACYGKKSQVIKAGLRLFERIT
jgi:hypothetical protein